MILYLINILISQILLSQTKCSVNILISMEQVETGLKDLRESVGQGVRDHSLVSFLRERVEDVRLDGLLVKKYCDYLFKLYDLSNSSFFITRPPHAKRC